MNGTQYANWVGQYIKSNFSNRGVSVFTEVYMGKSIIGKNRRVDILVLDEENNKAVAIECKCQNVSGTADEKVPYTLNDASAMQMDSYVVYGGEGFSKGITHMLEASELACYAMPSDGNENNFNRTASTKELDQLLAMRFSWWDIFTENKTAL
ncbi:PD-(D/E)XK nuclease superfamily protein [Colwellia psychrerythraea]|uniref:DUF234 DEXX-box ATPase n=1 Tax=Colwellia psychrerythraea TaxID=28229 RepID=A0A099KLE4_COLPS|nr:PD-(D/E)XK nuclease superfamily protein [Colwellia psychrerythraea]KGJ91574.1 DUF234 DEXX-box ATPase [Colwellia psychrerythraea]